MSNKNRHNNPNHVNYSKISTTPTVVEPTPETVSLMGVQITPAVVEPESVTTVATTAPVEPIDGIVSGCKRLNVRKEPARYGEIICEVTEGTALMIDRSESTDDWFKVYTEAGVEGFCMKNFVTINA